MMSLLCIVYLKRVVQILMKIAEIFVVKNVKIYLKFSSLFQTEIEFRRYLSLINIYEIVLNIKHTPLRACEHTSVGRGMPSSTLLKTIPATRRAYSGK